MCCCRFARLTLLSFFLCAPMALRAQDASADARRPWVVGMLAQTDDAANRTFAATFDWGVSENTWLSFFGGHSRSPRDQADVSARTLSVAVDQTFGKVGFNFSAQRWGEPEEIESTDLLAALSFRGERVMVGLSYEQRDIDITLVLTGPLGGTTMRKTGLNANGAGARLRLALGENLRLSLSTRQYDYSRDLTLVPRIEILNRLSGSTLTLAQSFLDHEGTLGLEWTLGAKVLDVSLRQDESAVDRSQLKSIDVGFLFPLTPRVDMQLDIGRAVSDTLASGAFGGVLFLIYGG